MNYVYFKKQNVWQRYNLETDEFDETEPPLPSNEDIEFSEEDIYKLIKQELST